MKKIMVLLIAYASIFSYEIIAKPSDLSKFDRAYPNSSLNGNCKVCHTSGKSRNSYARDYQRANDNPSRIESIDSDGDGFDNITEIQAGTFPGSSSSKPSEPEIPPSEPQDPPSDDDVESIYIESFDSEGGSFKCSDTTCRWSSTSIDITGQINLLIKANAKSYAANQFENIDFLKMSYQVDDGLKVVFFDHRNDLGNRRINHQIDQTGVRLKITIEAMTTASNETYEVDALEILGTEKEALPNDPENPPSDENIKSIYREAFESEGGSFKCSNTTCSWVSTSIDIAGQSSLAIRAAARSYAANQFENIDFLKMSYRIDDGFEVVFFDHRNDLAGKKIDHSIDQTGFRLQITIEAMTTASNETYEVSDLTVFGKKKEIVEDEQDNQKSPLFIKSALTEGEEVTIKYNEGSGSSKDWIGIFRAEEAEESCQVNLSYVSWIWTNGSQGEALFRELESGQYRAQLYSDNSYCHIGEPVFFEVSK